MKTLSLIKLFFVLLLLSACSKKENRVEQKLWYKQPATQWNEALPIGNGRIGAMVFGGVAQEHVQYNEESLWNGEPNQYAHKNAFKSLDSIRNLLFQGKQKEAETLAMIGFMSTPLRQQAYQPFGDFFLNFRYPKGAVENYQRKLSLNKAIVSSSYRIGSVLYQRECFVSTPDQVLVYHVKADKRKALNFTVSLDAAHLNKRVVSTDQGLELEVKVADYFYESVIPTKQGYRLSKERRESVMSGNSQLVCQTDGDLINKDGVLFIKDAKEATLYLSASTNFVNYKDVSGDAKAKAVETISAVKKKTFGELRKAHLKEYQSLYYRFSLQFGEINDTVPTNERLINVSKGILDPDFLALYVQYGRYLMISSSRSGTFPATLQGIWNKDLKPSWDSKYTTNINLEMNYWLTNMTNLAVCNEPLFDLIDDLYESGKVTAREHYNCEGWVFHHNTDIWRGTAPINHSNHGIWLGGSGWLSTHLWTHFDYTQDTAFLEKRAYPIMRDAALFYTQFLVKDPISGYLISTPSNSPENGGLVAGPTMDHQIIRELFRDCIKASIILNKDEQFCLKLKHLIPQIAPNKIGQYGQLQEWMEDVDNPQNHHRHVSHLWGVYPGSDITWQTPSIMNAAKKSLEMRGDEGTGWSLAWKINFWARFLDGEHAYTMLQKLFRPLLVNGVNMHHGGSYPNLFDAHPPFQIDGNFGASAGILELLVQSHLGTIDLLPALPKVLKDGAVEGFCTRGGFELSFEWKNNVLSALDVYSKQGGKCCLRYKNKRYSLVLKKGEKATISMLKFTN